MSWDVRNRVPARVGRANAPDRGRLGGEQEQCVRRPFPGRRAARARCPVLLLLSYALPCCCFVLFRDSEEFPEVLRWRAEVAETEGSLGTLLRQFRQTVQISSLEYKSLQVGRLGGPGWEGLPVPPLLGLHQYVWTSVLFCSASLPCHLVSGAACSCSLPPVLPLHVECGLLPAGNPDRAGQAGAQGLGKGAGRAGRGRCVPENIVPGSAWGSIARCCLPRHARQHVHCTLRHFTPCRSSPTPWAQCRPLPESDVRLVCPCCLPLARR